MNGLLVFTALLAPAAPVPAEPGTPKGAAGVDRYQAENTTRS
jgi:hypothetical protein